MVSFENGWFDLKSYNLLHVNMFVQVRLRKMSMFENGWSCLKSCNVLCINMLAHVRFRKEVAFEMDGLVCVMWQPIMLKQLHAQHLTHVPQVLVEE